MKISAKFQSAIEHVLLDHPMLEVEHGTEEARAIVAQFIAKESPDLLDPENPMDALFSTLARFQQP